jgi:hypothetical protein
MACNLKDDDDDDDDDYDYGMRKLISKHVPRLLC